MSRVPVCSVRESIELYCHASVFANVTRSCLQTVSPHVYKTKTNDRVRVCNDRVRVCNDRDRVCSVYVRIGPYDRVRVCKLTAFVFADVFFKFKSEQVQSGTYLYEEI